MSLSGSASKPQDGKVKKPHEGHALFPVDPEKHHSQGEIFFIYVERDGQMCPDKFTRDELPDASALFERFGGGSYLLRAGPQSNVGWSASARLVLPGPKKPLFAATAEPAAAEPARSSHLPPEMQMFMQLMVAQSQQTQAVIAGAFSMMGQALSTRAAPPESPAMLEIVKGLATRAMEGGGNPAQNFEQFFEVFNSGVEFARGISDGRAEREQHGSAQEFQAILSGVKEVASIARAKNPPVADPLAALVAAGRAAFGPAAAEMSDAEVANRYVQHRTRQERAPNEAAD